MEGFNLTKLREYIPKDLPSLPRLPSWPSHHHNTDPDETGDRAPASNPDLKGELSVNINKAEPDLVIEEPNPISAEPKSNLDLINECDNFPYYQTDTGLFLAHINTYYGLYVKSYPNTELGYILPSVAQVFRGLPNWNLNDSERSLTLVTGETEEERSRAVAMTCQALRGTGHFKILEGWRDELYPVYGPKRDLLFNIERAASALFGVVTYGCHLTAYTKSKRAKSETQVEGGKDELLIWVPRRASTKQTYGGMLDNTVAGGIATGESPFECVVRESAEEASLPEEIVRHSTMAVGAVTYFHIRDHRAGGGTRLLQPECQYVYDLELPDHVVPKPSDDEVEGFELKSINEVKEALRAGDFKPNCALVLLDFFVRHGILTSKDEGYVEIVGRLHRRLEFPTV